MAGAQGRSPMTSTQVSRLRAKRGELTSRSEPAPAAAAKSVLTLGRRGKPCSRNPDAALKVPGRLTAGALAILAGEGMQGITALYSITAVRISAGRRGKPVRPRTRDAALVTEAIGLARETMLAISGARMACDHTPFERPIAFSVLLRLSQADPGATSALINELEARCSRCGAQSRR
jgi:hypothetical protein